MPRTKISKNIKRNRDAANREEKIRECEAAVEQFMISLDRQAKNDLAEIHLQVDMIKKRIPKQILQMTMEDFKKLNINKFSQYQVDSQNANCLQQSQALGSLIRSAKQSRDDEGYLTEDSVKGGRSESSQQFRSQIPSRGRTPGPLCSAKSKERQRRSKSACSDFNLPGLLCNSSSSSVQIEHIARNKLRTPNAAASRSKAASADRYSTYSRESQGSPTALLRWPKPGERVISMQGSPLVAQIMPESYANVNIPVRNGVLSLRPKRLACLNPEIIENIDPITFCQIKTLQSNLNLIISYANKKAGI